MLKGLGTDYNILHILRECLYFSGERESRAFPSHQPMLDPPQIKQMYNSFLTSSMAAYGQGSRDAGQDNSASETHIRRV